MERRQGLRNTASRHGAALFRRLFACRSTWIFTVLRRGVVSFAFVADAGNARYTLESINDRNHSAFLAAHRADDRRFQIGYVISTPLEGETVGRSYFLRPMLVPARPMERVPEMILKHRKMGKSGDGLATVATGPPFGCKLSSAALRIVERPDSLDVASAVLNSNLVASRSSGMLHSRAPTPGRCRTVRRRGSRGRRKETA